MENDGRTTTTTSRKLLFETSSLSSRIGLNKSHLSRRKFSFPTSLNPNLLGLSNTSATDNFQLPGNILNRRRFSNVGDVTRKLSTTIGWRSVTVPVDEVIAQGRVLCGQFIRNRLKRSGIFNKKLGLYRLTSTVGSSNAIVVREVIPSLICAGIELERNYPKLYSNIARQATLSPGAIVISGKAAAALMIAIGQELFKNDINWGKIVSIFSISGGLAVDCVCQGHPEYLHSIVDGMVEIFEHELAEWIANNGGWTTLSNQCKNPNEEISSIEYASIVGFILATLFIIYLIVRFVLQFGFL